MCRPTRSKLIRQPKVKFDPDDFAVEQVFYKSKDGTRVPMMLAYRKDLDERSSRIRRCSTATAATTFRWSPRSSPSTSAGWNWAACWPSPTCAAAANTAKIGTWPARRVKKQNVFDDFIAAAEWLIREKRTTSDKLAIMGGSNGGLLVGAVEVQRPDLFGACIPMVGVLDMLRFQEFTAGQFWRDEYGYIEKEDEFKSLLAYSPYHNIKEGTKYPPTLIMTADTDDRVVPMHSFKFARRAAARPGRRRADPAADRKPSRPRRRHAGQEADRKRRRPLGVFGEGAANGDASRGNVESNGQLAFDRLISKSYSNRSMILCVIWLQQVRTGPP